MPQEGVGLEYASTLDRALAGMLAVFTWFAWTS